MMFVIGGKKESFLSLSPRTYRQDCRQRHLTHGIAGLCAVDGHLGPGCHPFLIVPMFLCVCKNGGIKKARKKKQSDADGWVVDTRAPGKSVCRLAKHHTSQRSLKPFRYH